MSLVDLCNNGYVGADSRRTRFEASSWCPTKLHWSAITISSEPGLQHNMPDCRDNMCCNPHIHQIRHYKISRVGRLWVLAASSNGGGGLTNLSRYLRHCMGENRQTVLWAIWSLQKPSKLGLVAYATLMFIPIFNNNAGIHQWDIQVINLIRWTKVSHMFFSNPYRVSKTLSVLDRERNRDRLYTHNIHHQTFHSASLPTNLRSQRQD